MSYSKEDYIKYRISRSDEAFNDALVLAGHGSWNSCINRLYYSAFYLAMLSSFKTT